MMKDSKKAQWKTCSVSKVFFSYGYDIKIGNSEKENGHKIEHDKKIIPLKGWGCNLFLGLAVIVYIILIFKGIVDNNESVVLLGSVFAFCYELKTSTWFKRFSKSFYSFMGTTLNNKKFISFVSLAVGLIVFLLECHFHIISNHIRFGISGFEGLLMGISLLLLFYDSRQTSTVSSDLDPDKINRIEIIQVFQKSSPEDFS